MDLLRTDSNAARYIAGRLAHEDCTVIDIGCSGGLDPGWRSFGERLRAVGIDASLGEVARLNAAEQNPKVRFFAGFAGLPRDHPLRQHGEQLNTYRRGIWHSLSTYAGPEYAAGRSPVIAGPTVDLRELEVRDAASHADLESRLTAHDQSQGKGLAATSGASAAVDEKRERVLLRENRWLEMALADASETILVPALLNELGVTDVDFVKIDVDSVDYEILWSLSDTLENAHVLGAMLEVNFFGSETPHHHTFHNTDRFMRERGFDLYGLTIRPYTSAALPAPYAAGLPGPNVSGRPVQGDALYMRNTGIRSAQSDPESFSDEKLAKLAALFALFGLPDQAAEVVLRFRERLRALMDTEHALDLLALDIQGARKRPRRYADYMREFAKGHAWFSGQGKA
jgi:hypothetical protein